MKVLFCASEALPFAATGGLADVAGSLPQALRTRLIGCRVVMPLYESVPQELREKMKFLTSISVPVAWRRQYCGIFEAKVGNVIYYLIDNQYYFKRQGLYGHFDDAERFAFFSRAVLGDAAVHRVQARHHPRERLADRACADLLPPVLREQRLVQRHQDAVHDPQHPVSGPVRL